MWYIASEENQAYLAHHGVKGMKWGTRRNRRAYAVASRHGYNRMGFKEAFKNPVWRLKTTRDDQIKKEYVKRGGNAQDYEKVRADSMRRRGKARFIGGLATAGVSNVASGIASHLVNKSNKLNDFEKQAINNTIAKNNASITAAGAGYATLGAIMNKRGNNALKKMGALDDKKKRR
jgi:hypothetical protein